MAPEAAKEPQKIPFSSDFATNLDQQCIKKSMSFSRLGFGSFRHHNLQFEDFVVVVFVIWEVKSDATTVGKRRFVQLKIMKIPCNLQ